MTTARSLLIDERRAGCYHLISRCVRRAFLCGDAAGHRRTWLEQGFRTQPDAFAVDVLTSCVMSNHFHIVIRYDPEQAQQWSVREVVERCCIVFPDRDPATGEPIVRDPAHSWLTVLGSCWVPGRLTVLGSWVPRASSWALCATMAGPRPAFRLFHLGTAPRPPRLVPCKRATRTPMPAHAGPSPLSAVSYMGVILR